jgi:nicotinate-nucleotide adenylyltransferase
MKIGLYGGTFDPPHNAHLTLAEWVQKELQLEYIYFIPTAIHAFKNNSDLSPPLIRLKLVKKAIEGYDKFRVSRIELDRPETSYTVHTLKKFRQFENLPKCELYYMMGSDNLAELHRWKDPELIMKLAKIVVLRRSVKELRAVNPDIIQKVIFLESPIIDLSATEIRNKIKLGIDCSDKIPSTVLKMVNEYGLYGSQGKK